MLRLDDYVNSDINIIQAKSKKNEDKVQEMVKDHFGILDKLH